MKLLIVGYGWLGQLLAPQLVKAGHAVYVTRRTAMVAADSVVGVKGLVLDLNLPVSANEQMASIFNDAIVICAIAPGKQDASNNYVQSLQHLTALMQQYHSRAVVHFSSSGIYQGLDGDVDESVTIMAQHMRVKLLADGELALQQFHRCVTLRLAGLMGPGRHPGRYIANKILPDPAAPLNMVHATDIIAAVQLLLTQPQLPVGIFNLCCPTPISRQQFYQRATSLTGTEVAFTASTSCRRRVCPQRFIHQFGFTYRFASASDGLMYCD
jgi:nucleoside-diphosphate-sugar epimerase